MPFEWSLNPYRGCAHSCVYCYARPTHEFLGLGAGKDFQEVIFAKVNAPEVVRQELSKRSWRGDNVVIGTATDPYQQAESRYQITRHILEAFCDFRNPVSITTKSPMVLRDLEILTELNRHAEVSVHFTVTTMDEELWRKIEPTTAKPKKRLEALRALHESGIRTAVFLSPVLPGITDSPEHLETVVAAAAGTGVDFIYTGVLRLGPGITEYYLPFLEREFPDLLPRYRGLYARNYASPAYVQRIEATVSALKRRYGVTDAAPEVKMPAPQAAGPVQLGLFA